MIFPKTVNYFENHDPQKINHQLNYYQDVILERTNVFKLQIFNVNTDQKHN